MGVYSRGPRELFCLEEGLKGPKRPSDPTQVAERPAGPRPATESMRIRAFILTTLILAWLLPTAGSACDPPTPASEAQADHHDGHEHARGPSHHADRAHDQAHVRASLESEPGTSPEEPTCCVDEARAPAAIASLPEANPRPKPIPLVLASGSPIATRSMALSAGLLRRLQPPPVPYAHTRRPLLI